MKSLFELVVKETPEPARKLLMPNPAALRMVMSARYQHEMGKINEAYAAKE